MTHTCETCGNDHEDENSFSVCDNCRTEVCEECSNNGLCEDCFAEMEDGKD